MSPALALLLLAAQPLPACDAPPRVWRVAACLDRPSAQPVPTALPVPEKKVNRT